MQYKTQVNKGALVYYSETINNKPDSKTHICKAARKGCSIRIQEAPIPAPVRKISLVPVIRCAKYLERVASVVNKERLTEANRTKHSSACK